MDRRMVWILITLAHFAPSTWGLQGSIPPEYRLFDYIFNKYNPSVRPKMDSSEPIEATVSYNLNSISSVNEKQQTITVVGWIQLEWVDELLVWNPEDFDNVSETVVPSNHVWLPDASFFQGVDKLFFSSSDFPPMIRSDGNILYTPGGPITLTCQFDLTNYPFDVQRCTIEVSSWSNPETRLVLSVGQLNLDNFKENGEWHLIGTDLLNHTYVDTDGVYSEIVFTLRLRRKALYHVLNILLPIILLSLLNLLVFRLPPESGEKVSLSITVLLAFSVWLLMLNGIMPSSSDYVPIMGMYITTFMIISTVSVFITVYVICIHNTPQSSKIPTWIMKIYELRNNVCIRNRVTQISKGVVVMDEELTWKKIASTVDDIALYSLSLFIVLLVVVVVGNLMLKTK